MKDLVILLSTVAVITAAVIYISKQPGGYIETKGGSECSWRTAGDATTGYRDHMFNCRCKRSGREYNCTYRGDPDSNCPKFYKKIIDYFLEVVSAVAESEHGCDAADFVIPLCQEVVNFRVQRIGEPSPADC